jgi:hypothetical protein
MALRYFMDTISPLTFKSALEMTGEISREVRKRIKLKIK